MSAVLRPEPRIEPLTTRDLDAVVAVEATIYDFPWTFGNFRDSLAAGYSCWGMHSGDGLVGYAVMMLGVNEAHLLNLSIAAPVQRRGYGGKLLEHLLGVARGYQAHVIFLEVRPTNPAARRLYLRHGFEQVAVRKGYYPARHGREDALLLSLLL
jgi:[ribosomal protein S18]-alanine N-acetyltransferase